MKATKEKVQLSFKELLDRMLVLEARYSEKLITVKEAEELSLVKKDIRVINQAHRLSEHSY